ncbi:MAG: hypothetical protein ABR603_06730 [Pyrinomonadaceae bacterium]
MFCPYCGTESTQGLNYCKRCGGNLAPLAQGGAQETRPAVVAQGAAWAAGLTTAAVAIIGIGTIFPLTSELAMRGMPAAAVVWISLFLALSVVGCVAMLLRFWSLLFGVRAAGDSGRAAPALPDAKAVDTRELGASRFDSLNPASVPSVTEQTTRTLEPEAVNRKP